AGPVWRLGVVVAKRRLAWLDERGGGTGFHRRDPSELGGRRGLAAGLGTERGGRSACRALGGPGAHRWGESVSRTCVAGDDCSDGHSRGAASNFGPDAGRASLG